jgi:hypothetical protein
MAMAMDVGARGIPFIALVPKARSKMKICAIK